MLAGIDIITVADNAPILAGHLRRQARLRDPVHEPLGVQPVCDQLRHGDEREPVLGRVSREVVALHRRAVVVQDLTDHAGGVQPGEPGEIDRGLGMANALQHAPIAPPQRVHVPGAPEIAPDRCRIDRHLNRFRTVSRADARRHAEARGGIDADRERRSKRVGVLDALWRKPELIDALASESETDHAFRLQHRVDQRGRDELGGANEVAFVLAILVIGDDNELAGANVRDGLRYGPELHGHRESGLENRASTDAELLDPRWSLARTPLPAATSRTYGCNSCLTYLPITSPSTWTVSPIARPPSVVWRRV